MRDILAKRITINEGGKPERMTLQEVMLRSIAKKAAAGELRCVTFVLNLVNSPDAAGSDTIDQSSLSPEDRALFEQMFEDLSADVYEPDAAPEPPTHPPNTEQLTMNEEASFNDT